MSRQIAYIYSPLFLKHEPGGGHLERPDRLKAIESHLKATKLWEKLQHYKPKASPKKYLLSVHSKQLVDYNTKQKGKSYFVLDSGDTVLSKYSIDAAYQAAGAGLMAADLIFKHKKHTAVFAAVRPPGHHAEYDQSMGFCIFNSVAVAAAYAIDMKYAKKVLIIDWDVHHGNGTQNIFYNRDDVFYFSMHQWPFFPGTGAASETGLEKGHGYTFNVPLHAGQDDEVYLSIFKESLLKIETTFSPDLVLVSAGFDAHQDDLLGQMRLSEFGFGKMTRLLVEFAKKHCQGRIISMLEGGYSLSGLQTSVFEHLKALGD